MSSQEFYWKKKSQKLADETSLPKVTILEAKGIDKPIELTLPSSLDAINITPIWARVDGYIKTFLADIGDVVKEGDVLAEIETPELDQQYEQAVAELNTSKARLNIAKLQQIDGLIFIKKTVNLSQNKKLINGALILKLQ